MYYLHSTADPGGFNNLLAILKKFTILAALYFSVQAAFGQTALIPNGDFSNYQTGLRNAGQDLSASGGANTFTSDLYYAGYNVPVVSTNQPGATDRRIAVINGNITYTGSHNQSGNINQDPFPGDPVYNIPSTSNWLLYNGSTITNVNIWEKTITMQRGATYRIWAYMSHAGAPGNGQTSTIVRFTAGPTGGTISNYGDHTLLAETTTDIWTRYEFTYTAPSGTGTVNVDLAIRDIGSSGNGDRKGHKLAVTQVGGTIIPTANNVTTTAISTNAAATGILPLSGTDPDGSIVRYTIKSLPVASAGILYLNGVAVTIGQELTTTEAAQLTFDPLSPYTGNATFTFSATDNYYIESANNATYTIPVVPNVAPVAANVTTAAMSASANATLISPFSASDSDGSITGFTILTLPTGGILYVNGVAAFANQSISVAQASQLSFDPTVAGTANRTFTYRATDNNGAISNTATYTIPVVANLAPVAANVTTSAILFSANATAISPLSASDSDGSIASFTIVTIPVGGTLFVNGVAASANQTINPTQATQLSFDPLVSASGNITFTYRATDNNGAISNTATYTIPITPNSVPIAANITNASIHIGATATAISALSATDSDGTISNYTILTLPTGGTLYVNGVAATANQVITVAQASQLSFDPSGSVSGNVSFTYRASDNYGANSNNATFTIPIAPNVLPVAANITTAAIHQGAAATAISALSATDPDGTIANYTILTLPTGGTLYVNGIAATANQVISVFQASQLSFDPSGTVSGNRTFNYRATDNTGANSNNATYTIPITPNAVPIASNITNSAILVSANATAISALSATDSDGTISNYTILTLPTGGTLYVNGVAATANQVISVAQASQLSFDPSGLVTGNVSFTYRATDDLGANSNTATFTIPISTLSISGIVFDDVNYGGGAGRNYATANTAATASGFASNAIGRSGARVELYSAAGNFISATTTGAGGTYSFNNLAATTYTVRVVSTTVTSVRGGTGLIPVVTFVNGDVNRVGGENPALLDAGNGTTTLGALATTTTAAQARSTVSTASGILSGVNFGFNFNTIVNTRASGQGSLAQFITNANALPNTNLAQAGQTAGKEVSIFMIPNGTARPGLRAGLANALTAGVATITLTSTLPTITGTNGANTVIDGSTQTANVGNTNTVILDTAKTVGTDSFMLAAFDGPEIEILGAGLTNVFVIQTSNVSLTGFAVLGGTNAAIQINSGSSGYLLDGLVIGCRARSVSRDATYSSALGANIVSGAGAGSVVNSVLAYTGNSGVTLNNGSASTPVTLFRGNRFIQNGYSSAGGDGISIGDGAITGPVLVEYNYFHSLNSSAVQFEIGGFTASIVTNNTIIESGEGGATVSALEGSAICFLQRNGTNSSTQATTISKNIITSSQASAIVVGWGMQNVTISQNAISTNGGISIDLVPTNFSVGSAAPNNLIYGNGNGVSANDGTLQGISSLAANRGIDYPVITTANATATTLQVSGYIGTGSGQSAFGGATVELFVALNDGNNTGPGGLQHGELAQYIGSLTAAANGTFSGTITLPAGITLTTASLISGTATRVNIGTSEAGPNRDVNMAPVAANVTHDPVIVNTALTTTLDPLSATDVDGNVTNYTIVTLPLAAHGQLYLNSALVTAGQTITAAQGSQLRFDPVNTFAGNATFTFNAIDNSGAIGNTATYTIPVVADQPAVYTVTAPVYIYSLSINNILASVTDPDGAISTAVINSGSVPAGATFSTTAGTRGRISVSNINTLTAGTYNLQITTTDANGGITVHNISITLINNRDGDGINDLTDIDDNNDGIPDLIANGADAYGDHNNKGIRNYLDPAFMHPLGAFVDVNGDGINDRFDTDLDGIINSLDIDIDNDGITNAIEANGGVAPAGYFALTGTILGATGANGMPDVAETVAGSGISILAMMDPDSDGLRDFADIDSDNDGITDNQEGQPTIGFVARANADADRDGLDDAYDASCGCATNGTPITPVNTDGDALPDYRDLDTDGDTQPDYFEGFDYNADGAAINDLLSRALTFETASGNLGYYTTTDADGNGTADWFQDANNNGIRNYLDPTSTFYHDTDGDGLIDLFDADNFGAPAVTIDINGFEAYRNAAINTPLPVTFISFKAEINGDVVLVKWATASEENNAGFEVERSADGKTFEKIGQVTGKGTSSQTNVYSFTDKYPLPNVSYYRLRQIDENGDFSFSSVSAVRFTSAAATLTASVYPNPAKDWVTIQLNEKSEATISVINVNGQIVLSQKSTQEMVKLNLGNLPAGTYVVQVVTDLGVVTKQIIKL